MNTSLLNAWLVPNGLEQDTTVSILNAVVCFYIICVQIKIAT